MPESTASKAGSSTSKYIGGEELQEVNSASVPRALHITELIPRPEWLHEWEHRRPKWVQEVAGEFFGVFFYTYAGLGSVATANTGALTGNPTAGSLLQIAFAYTLGIILAIVINAMSSSGHFNPPLTIAYAMFRGFPWKKVPLFLFAQFLGAYVASMVVYGSWRETIIAIEATLKATGKEDLIFTPGGTAGIFALYPPPNNPLRWVLFNEMAADFFIGIVIWGALDPSNIWVTPSSIPSVIGFAYFIAIAGFSPNGLSANPARDFGARLMTISLWGTKGWGGAYAAIAALAPFPATILAAYTYELLLYDSSRVVTSGAREYITNTDRHREHKAYKYNLRANKRRARAAANTIALGPVPGSEDNVTGSHVA